MCVTERVSVAVCIREMLSFTLGCDIGIPELYFFVAFLSPPRQMLSSTSLRSRELRPSSQCSILYSLCCREPGKISDREVRMVD
jgi:hypothetical protein